MQIEVSDGEIIDKLTILEIKIKYIKDNNKISNIIKEYSYIKDISSDLLKNTKIFKLYSVLKETNQKLWDIEDNIRIKESKKEFDNNFIDLARSVYINNDHRAKIKKEINKHSNSNFIEEKSYAEY